MFQWLARFRAWNKVDRTSSRTSRAEDLRLRIQAVIEEKHRSHQALSQQASAVIGNARQLEMKVNRQLGELEKLQSTVRAANSKAREADQAGDAELADQYRRTAKGYVTQSIGAEQALAQIQSIHKAAITASEAAQRQVVEHAAELQRAISDRTSLLSMLEQARMTELSQTSLRQMQTIARSSAVSDSRAALAHRYVNALSGAAGPGTQQEQLRRRRSARLEELRQAGRAVEQEED